MNLKGEVRFRLASVNTPETKKLESEILQIIEQGGDPRAKINQLNGMSCTKDVVSQNVVATVFHEMIADYIANVSPTNDIIINYGALGTGTTTPAIGDTTLQVEEYRKQISSLSSASNVVFVTVFYSATEVEGTFYEHAFFSDASGTIDTGVLVNRVLIDSPTGLVKSNTETLTIDYTLTIQ